jgi:hypothetical protein
MAQPLGRIDRNETAGAVAADEVLEDRARLGQRDDVVP